MTEGFIKLYRILLEDELWQHLKPEFKTIMVTLLLMASHKKTSWIWNNTKYTCMPGEFVTSLESIKKNCGKGISLQNIRSCLKLLENYGFLTNKSTKQNRLILIQNWSKYQNGNKAINSQLTNNSQSTNNQLTTIKNVKNDKNVKNKYIYAEFVSMLPEEYQKLVDKYGEVLTKKFIEKLDNWKGAKGKTKDKGSDYRKILNWVVDAVMEKSKVPDKSDSYSRAYKCFKDFCNGYCADAYSKENELCIICSANKKKWRNNG